MDNSAARAILQRSGVGRVRRLDAKLFGPVKVKDDQLFINAVDAERNVSGLGSKVLNVSRGNLLLGLLNVRDSTDGFELGKELDVLKHAKAVRVACKLLKHVSKRDRTGDAARICRLCGARCKPRTPWALAMTQMP